MHCGNVTLRRERRSEPSESRDRRARSIWRRYQLDRRSATVAREWKLCEEDDNKSVSVSCTDSRLPCPRQPRREPSVLRTSYYLANCLVVGITAHGIRCPYLSCCGGFCHPVKGRVHPLEAGGAGRAGGVVRVGERTDRQAGAFARVVCRPMSIQQPVHQPGGPVLAIRVEAIRRDEKVRGRAGRVGRACGRS
ncbi:hypothetical protein AAT19DRAFT_10441 [Rhodotorula toruloides]|uniref:Uncharacterized protein n=1 Tax=Rhodotorula toruloides TaxID=5286 RepID=A0A2S9ZYT0_RHOTO|nr:hypothetical protein AAT19DRAFT_10441 [Rhodotorula toruloides]